jgi:hypothetical protein
MAAFISAAGAILLFALIALPGSDPTPAESAQSVSVSKAACDKSCQPDLGSEEAAQDLADRARGGSGEDEGNP